MRALLSTLARLSVGSALFVCGCGGTDEGSPEEGAGGSAEPDEPSCGADLDVTILAGKGVGDQFVPFENGDMVMPYFGSQIGMEVEISVLLTGFDPAEIDSIEVLLNVESAPIGLDSFSPADISCDSGESATIETPVLIDVTEHPTVASVAQLNGRDAEIEVRVHGPEGIQDAHVGVVIEL